MLLKCERSKQAGFTPRVDFTRGTRID